MLLAGSFAFKEQSLKHVGDLFLAIVPILLSIYLPISICISFYTYIYRHGHVMGFCGPGVYF